MLLLWVERGWGLGFVCLMSDGEKKNRQSNQSLCIQASTFRTIPEKDTNSLRMSSLIERTQTWRTRKLGRKKEVDTDWGTGRITSTATQVPTKCSPWQDNVQVSACCFKSTQNLKEAQEPESRDSPASLTEKKHFQSLYDLLVPRPSSVWLSWLPAICLVLESKCKDVEEAYQAQALGDMMERIMESHHCKEKYVPKKKKEFRGKASCSVKTPTLITEFLRREEVFLLCCTFTVYPLHTTVSWGKATCSQKSPPDVARFRKDWFYSEATCVISNLPFDNVCKTYFWNCKTLFLVS